MYFHNIVIDGINIDDFVGVWYSGPLVGHIGFFVVVGRWLEQANKTASAARELCREL